VSEQDGLVSFDVTGQTPAVRFLALLSDGRTVVQDDRPGAPHAWLRLVEFLGANPQISISCLRLQLPGCPDDVMPGNQRGYLFGHKGLSVQGVGECHFVGIGHFDGQTARINWHHQANPVIGFSEERTRAACGFLLIENPG
jgi:hypothetical protein